MKATDFFVRYDRRRERWQVTPVGWVVAALAMMVALAAAVGFVRAIHHPIDHLKMVDAPDSAPDPIAVVPASSPVTTTRPISWVVEAETLEVATGDGSSQPVLFHAPDEIEAMVIEDFNAAMGWWNANQSNPDELEANLPTYFAQEELVRSQQWVVTMRSDDRMSLVYDVQPVLRNADQEALVQAITFTADGQGAFVSQLLGESGVAQYRLSDGTLIAGSQRRLPAMRLVYRLAFDSAHRRWRIAEQMAVEILEGD